ncbi:MAG: hypothetical protein WA849_12710, partial [Candidatus Udaeobacter sp.]
MNPVIQLKQTTLLFLVAFGLAAFGPSPTAQAIFPPPDGCYPGFTTAEGCNALNSLTSGAGNTGVGWRSLFSNTTSNFNTGVGAGTLLLNTGDSNTGVGAAALLLNATGTENTAVGTAVLLNNDSDAAGLATNNTAVGAAAMLNNVDGSENTVVGTGAGPNLVAGFNNTYVGNFEGSFGGTDESSTIRIGDITEDGFGSAECFIGGIFNNNQPRGGTVVVVTLDLANDHLGWDVVTSPDQFGSAPSVPARSAPARRDARHSAGTPQSGAVTEEVEKTNPDLVVRDKE